MVNEINVVKILEMLLRRLWLIILMMVLVGAMVFAYSRYFVDPVYTATTTMYVYVDETSTGATYYDPTKAAKLVNSCLVILTSDKVLNQVAQTTDLGYTTDEIYKMISVKPKEETEFFTVNVSNKIPQHAKKIADALGEIAPDEILRFYKTGTVEVLDQSSLPEEPSSPNIQQNTIIGALIGVALAMMLIFIIEMFSTSIKTEQDLIDNFNLPVLGSIPEFENTVKSKKSKHSRRYGYHYSH